MKKRYKIPLGLAAVCVAAAIAPIVYVETACRPSEDGSILAPLTQSLLPKSEHRPAARTLLTYPEWHIVYSADSFGRHLMAGKAPSAYRYWNDIKGFWSSTCALNRASGGSSEASDAKIMIYTIGVSFSAEMAIKGAWENTIGWIAERLGGWSSPDDQFAARVQENYGAFMHQTPWYKYPFGVAFKNLWTLGSEGHGIRHLERQIALSGEYGVKAGYAKLIGAASGATLGADELTLRYVVEAPTLAEAQMDPAKFIEEKQVNGATLFVLEAPRYEIFTDHLKDLAKRPVRLREIAGNDRIFISIWQKEGERRPPSTLLSMPLGDKPGWERVGMMVPVPELLETIRQSEANGAMVEHVYDY